MSSGSVVSLSRDDDLDVPKDSENDYINYTPDGPGPYGTPRFRTESQRRMENRGGEDEYGGFGGDSIGGNASGLDRRMSEPTQDFDHNRWLFESKGIYGIGNAFWQQDEDSYDHDTGMSMSDFMDKPWKPLARKRKVPAAIISPYRLLILIRLLGLVCFLAWRVTNPNTDAMWLWGVSIVCELWFAFSWLLDILPKLNPINRSADLPTLKEKFESPSPTNPHGRSDLPGVDVFISDPEKEPPLVTANTILSIIAVEYPVEKVSVYISDDGGAIFTFEAMAEAVLFAQVWVPFCRKHDIEPRNPDSYFSQKTDPMKNKKRPDFVKDRRWIKREYDEFKVRINGLPEVIRKRCEMHNSKEVKKEKALAMNNNGGAVPADFKFQKTTWLADGTHWPGTWFDPIADHKKGDHAGILQVLYTLGLDVCSGTMHSMVFTLHDLMSTPDSSGKNKKQAKNTAMPSDLDDDSQPLTGHPDLNLPKQFGNSTMFVESIAVAEFQGRPLADHINVKNGRPPGALLIPRPPLDAPTVAEAIAVISCWFEDKTELGDIIGWIYGSVTEDVVTGYRMHNHGWRSIYCITKRDAFRGTAPINLTDRLHQVLRWATGSVEIFYSRNNPMLVGPHLKFLQRIAYFNVAVYPFTSIFLVVYCFIPAFCLFTGKFIVKTLNIYFLLITVTLVLISLLEVKWSGIGLEELWRNEQFWLIGGTSAHFAAVIQGLLKVIAGVEISFTLTSKSAGEDEEDVYADLHMVKWTSLFILPLTISVVNIMAMVIGISRTIYSVIPQWNRLIGGLFFSFWVLSHLYPFTKGLMGRKGRVPIIIYIWTGLISITISLLWVTITNTPAGDQLRI
ncbi:unnamed protein product [Withania somnifera]